MTAAVTQTLCVPLTAELAVQVMDFVDSCLTGLGCAVSPRQANRLRIAVDEVSSNLLSYSSARQVTCQFSMQNGRIVLSFCDDGIPYRSRRPNRIPPPLPRNVPWAGWAFCW